MAIKAILFDLDGVISDTHLLHYEAYKAALKEVCGFDLTLELYDSIGSVPTRTRTDYLIDKDYIVINDDEHRDKLHATKRENTNTLIRGMSRDDKLISLLHRGKDNFDLKYAVASNASNEFVDEVLTRKEIMVFFDSVIGSYSVAKTKPHPMMYLYSMVNLGVFPHECLVIEDSNTGLRAGYASGANVYRVNNPDDVNDAILDLVEQMQ